MKDALQRIMGAGLIDPFVRSTSVEPLPSGETVLEGVRVDGVEGFDHVAGDGAGGAFVELADGRILYIGSERSVAIVGDDAGSALAMMLSCPGWQDALRFAGGRDKAAAREAWLAWRTSWSASDDPADAGAVAAILTLLERQQLGDPFGMLFDAVAQTQGITVSDADGELRPFGDPTDWPRARGMAPRGRAKPTDTHALAAIRPGDPIEKLADAIGERWLPLDPALGGRIDYLAYDLGFSARLDVSGRVGMVTIEPHFDPEPQIAGLRISMPLDEVRQVRPPIAISGLDPTGPYSDGFLDLGGATLHATIGYGCVTQIFIFDVGARYTQKPPLPMAPPVCAFDVWMVGGLQPRGTAAPDGWAFGLPRGITAQQWPLSWNDGMPLRHFFTLRVPEPYRAKGPELVALAFFGEEHAQSDGSDAIRALMGRQFDGRPLPGEVEPALSPFLDALRSQHPHAYMMRDILGTAFTAIWLTEEELNGPEVEPPAPILTAANAQIKPPVWLTIGSAPSLFGPDGTGPYNPKIYGHRHLKRRPAGPWDLIPFSLGAREDPNAGKQPVEDLLEPDADTNVDGYVPAYSEAWDALQIERPQSDARFGGTAYPQQALPHITPLFLEIEESMGDINMGTGNGQLDLVTMRFDWAQ